MRVDIGQEGQVMVITVEGKVDSRTAPELKERILPALSPGGRVLLDMTKVDFLSSAGLRLLLLMYRQQHQSEGAMVLVGVATHVKEVMLNTGFLHFFTLADTLGEGVISLGVQTGPWTGE